MIGVLHLIGGLAGIIPGIYSVDDVNEIYDFCQQHINETSCMEELFWEEETTTTVAITWALYYIIISSFLLFGIFKKKTTLFEPLMAAHDTMAGLLVLFFVVTLILQIHVRLPFLDILVFVIFSGLVILFEVYCLLVVRAYYKQLKKENEEDHRALTEHDSDMLT